MIRRYTISPPMPHLPGDTFAVVGGVLEQRRGGSIVSFRVLDEMVSAPLVGPEALGGSITAFFLEEPSMISLTITDVVHNADGSKNIFYGDSTFDESVTVATLNSWAGDGEGGSLARKLMAGYWKARSGDFSSATSVVGKIFQWAPELELGQFQVGSA